MSKPMTDAPTPIADELERHGARYYNNPRWHKKVFKQMRLFEGRIAELEQGRDRLQAELDSIDAVLSRRPALADKEGRAAKIEHACVTAGRESDKVIQLERQLAEARGLLEECIPLLYPYEQQPCEDRIKRIHAYLERTNPKREGAGGG